MRKRREVQALLLAEGEILTRMRLAQLNLAGKPESAAVIKQMRKRLPAVNVPGRKK